MMNRRSLIVGIPLGCALAPFARAQPQPQLQPKVIGVLNPYTGKDSAPFLARFELSFRELGYVKGTHYVMVLRMAEGSSERLRDFAEELVNLKVDLITATSTNAVAAAQRATATIPIVFTEVTDPVAAGFADSLARPGHNLTGLSNFSGELSQKRLQLMTQMLPGLVRVAYLVNPANPVYAGVGPRLQALAEPLGLRITPVGAGTREELEAAFKAMSAARAQAVYVMGDPFLWNQRQRIAELALLDRLPSMSNFFECVEAGGLMSYGADTRDAMRQAATYIDKIFRGAKPGDLPIERANKVDLVINRKTANAMQLVIPQVLLLQAERVIE